ncbi:hypothetical protein RO3G_05241 [Rhizopus delemar RA 99-880]|uniref:Uncharacterized protein n=1 Tax=Rhizopus delemar (strain RA 99-880 / ATCC MYA-4621 / FGSC 9543 / NRRL 43880) TaxID=246409 RepID=I1BWF6_RHIO9|nr:hypothetical protein RO3G_05241 [Rhizopus delemar RA 99-880]|eukprot:EIE80536.1 hypothetical protein RO3G_05241 [Rhizopus delemar RA 99-880]
MLVSKVLPSGEASESNKVTTKKRRGAKKPSRRYRGVFEHFVCLCLLLIVLL